jgi:ribonucleoside-diphosphate reductase alpha chain
MSFAMDNVSSGIEPVFSYSQERDVLDAFSKRTETVEDYGVHYFGVRGKRCSDVTINEHLNVLATAAKRVDSAVSKTCNVSPHIPWEDFKKIYDQAWALGCKGVTTFNPGGKRFAVLRSVDMELPKPQIFEVVVEGTQETPCNFDPKTGRSSCE